MNDVVRNAEAGRAWRAFEPDRAEQVAACITGTGYWPVDIPGASSPIIHDIMRQHAPGAWDAVGDETPLLTARHIPAATYVELLGADAWSRVQSFCIVRNPWERMLAVYQLMAAAQGSVEVSFPAFLRSLLEPVGGLTPWNWFGHHLRMVDFACVAQRIAVTQIIRFEHATSGLDTLSEITGERAFGDIEAGYFEQRRIRDYADYYSTASRDIVALAYAEDIDVFQYSFGTP